MEWVIIQLYQNQFSISMLDCPHNPMGHNKNIVLEGVLNTIPRRLLLIVQTFFKVVRLIESKVNNIYTGQSGP